FKAFDNKLAFTGFTPSTGTELYIGDAGSNNFIVSTANNDVVTKPVVATLNANIYPNPTTSKTTVEVSGKFKEVIISIADISGKIIWHAAYTNQSVVSLPTDKLTSGTYVVTIKSQDEIKTLKLIKK
ncbi:MAG: T9SS type A sorting domain-containing protein, partial [Parafilimonas sp.]